MIIAREKRNTNIIEYILYMFQVEDTIRACDFNIELIGEKVISQYKVSDKVRLEIKDWYANLILRMHEEGVKKSGHLSELTGLIDELNALHLKLIYDIKDPKYTEQYAFTRSNILEFGKKTGTSSPNEIHTCLMALYALLLLRLRRKPVSEETGHAMQTFSNMLALLNVSYRKAGV